MGTLANSKDSDEMQLNSSGTSLLVEDKNNPQGQKYIIIGKC